MTEPGPPSPPEADSVTVTYEGRDLEALIDLDNYYQWVIEEFAPFARGAGIEYGAGMGAVSARLRPAFDELELVENSSNLVAALRARFQNDDRVTVVQNRLEDDLPARPDRAADAVIMVNFLEHIEDDEMALREVARLLKPGGHLLLFVPALSFLYSAFDREMGHYRRYHRHALERLVAGAGLDIRKSLYFDICGVPAWWLVNVIGGSTRLNPRAMRFYDKMIVPITKALESVIKPPFGKNILIVAQRR